MIEDVVRADNQRINNSWVGGFPISRSSTDEFREVKNENAKHRFVASNRSEVIDVFAPIVQTHIVQIECVVGMQILNWGSQLEVLTASSRQEQIVDETLEHVYALERSNQGRMAARKLMIFVESNFKKKNLTLTSSLLEKVKLNFLGMHALIGLTRTTLRARSGLPAWDAVYRKSRRAVEERGFNADEMFIGMPRIEGAAKDAGNRAKN